MNILLFGTIAGQGGIQSHLRWLAKAIVDAGHQVLIITPQPPDKAGLTWEEASHNGIGIYVTRQKIAAANSVQRNAQQMLSLIKAVKQFDPDVYLGAGTSWRFSLLPLVLPQKTHCIFHEVMAGTAGSWHDPRWAVCRLFDDVVAQATPVGQNFARSFRWQKAIPTLPAIPEPLEFTAVLPQPVRKRVELGTAKAALFSRLVPWKKAFWLVQQWEHLQNVLGELHIHGTGPEEELIQTYIAERGIGDRVKCFGRYPEGQAYVDLLSSYDLTLLPTVGPEGAPLVLLESMACGVPFVAYGTGGIPDYGVDNPNVIVVPPEPWETDQAIEYTIPKDGSQETRAFVTAVKQMAQKLAMGEINQEELQQFYLERYSYDVLKNAWLNYLQQLV